MGRAIDMERDIDMLKAEVERLENVLRGVCMTIDEIEDKITNTKKKETANGKKKANNKGSSKSSGDSESGHGHSEDEDNKSGKSSS
tara:strand:+ start:1646 stop:1903 length:258 start_codon:yes stop_codon:yes gene_type:complete